MSEPAACRSSRTVTDGGSAIARMLPVGTERVLDRLIAEGVVTPAKTPKRRPASPSRPRAASPTSSRTNSVDRVLRYVRCHAFARRRDRLRYPPSRSGPRDWTAAFRPAVHRASERGVSEGEDRITVDPAICHGKPTVRGLRYPVQSLLELLASGMTIDEILDDYPDLEREDLLATLELGAKTAGNRHVPLGAA